MSLDLTAYKPHAGDEADADQISNAFTAIEAAINGGIDSASFAAGAIFDPYKIMQRGALDGDVLTWDTTAGRYQPETPSGGGGGGGGDVPVGTIVMWATLSAPSGWLLLEGQTVSRTAYADLFALWGTTFGSGDGSTTFGLPNMRQRVAVGRDSDDGQFDTIGGSGGSKTVTLTSDQLPTHHHDLNGAHAATGGATTRHVHPGAAGNFVTSRAGSGSSFDPSLTTIGGPGGANSRHVDFDTVTGLDTDHAHVVDGRTEDVGTGQAHSNLQPYMILCYIVKT